MLILQRKNSTNKGFTLVEVLVSAIILTVVVASVAVIISRGSKINREDMLRRRAYQVMEEVLGREDLHYKNYPTLLNLIGEDNTTLAETPYEVELYKDNESAEMNATVQRTLTKKLYTYGTSSIQIPCIEVSVTITYNNGDNTETLSTILTSRQ